ncbi:SGF29 tudor-like domain-containing protein [Neurospora crassa]|nr:SGF29 tudor-like domain-containing protein [Neurospora crassa]
MSSRNRQSRNPNRNSSSSTQGEEAQIWSQIKDEIRELVDSINTSNDQIRAILAQDSLIAKSREAQASKENSSNAEDKTDIAALEQTLDTLIRAGVGGADISKQKLQEVIEHVMVLRALVKAREESEGVVHSVGTPGPHSGSAGRDRNSSSLLGSGGRSSSARGHAGGKGDRGGDREGRGDRDRDRGDKDRGDRGDREKGEKEGGRDRDRNSERLGDKLGLGDKDRDKHSDRDLSSMYDFDGAGDSPVPSPLSSHTRKLGGANTTAGSDRASTARDSVPPRDTPSKDSVPPEPNTSTTSNGTTSAGPTTAGATQRAKVIFHKGQDVVFKPKASPASGNETTEWMLGRVQQVSGEGKSRRYRVQDADPDLKPDERVEYRTSASSMIPIPAAGEEEKKLPKLEKGKVVLALYPDSTTFYKAEVMGTEAEGEGEGKQRVKLRFEGEENSGTLQLVERRFVVEYRA